MQIIESIKQLANSHIAWADGPGWLLGVVLCCVVIGIVGVVTEERAR